MARPALVTGYMPYGGRGVNPAAEIARAVEGKTIAGAPVVSRLLPVAFAEILATAEALPREPRAFHFNLGAIGARVRDDCSLASAG